MWSLHVGEECETTTAQSSANKTSEVCRVQHNSPFLECDILQEEEDVNSSAAFDKNS